MHSPEMIPKPEDLSGSIVNPTLQVLHLNHPVTKFAQLTRNESKRDLGWLRDQSYMVRCARPEVVFIFRHPHKFTTQFMRAYDPMLFAVKVAHERMDILEASRLSGQKESAIRQVLEAAIENGIVIFPRRIP